jgi:hypothetical protein
MGEAWADISYRCRENPFIALGLLLFAMSGILGIHMLLKIVRSGSDFLWRRYFLRKGHQVIWESLRAIRNPRTE